MTRAVDLFSGGGAGWCLAARELGIDTIGLEWGAPECATRAVVGLPTIRTDVATYPAERFVGKVDGVMGSPPCQSFSSAGKRKGMADPRGQMVHEPMRYVRTIRPRWVALEQVPEVLIYWRWIARELREMGYSVWTGVLMAADYGVPQCRERAILLASLDRRAEPPAPTHSKHGHADLLGESLLPWVSMAEALGWGHGGTIRTGTKTGTAEGAKNYGQTPTDPAPTIALGHNASSWCWERPATTVVADARVAVPPHLRTNADKSWSSEAIPVEPWELGVLQGFPADHPWQPPHLSRQIGNAFPPPFALACLRSLVGPV